MVQQLEQLVKLVEVLTDIATDIAGRIELLIKLAGGTELKAQVKIQQPKEFKVLLIAVCY